MENGANCSGDGYHVLIYCSQQHRGQGKKMHSTRIPENKLEEGAEVASVNTSSS